MRGSLDQEHYEVLAEVLLSDVEVYLRTVLDKMVRFSLYPCLRVSGPLLLAEVLPVVLGNPFSVMYK